MTKHERKAVREALRILSLVAAREIGPQIATDARTVQPELERMAREPKRREPKVTAAGVSVEQRRDERRKRMADIREALRVKAGGECERCFSLGTEAHHVIGGGLRRHRESLNTMLLLCEDDHRLLHRGDPDTLEWAHAYCNGSGMHEAAAALAKRIDKVHEARRASERAQGKR